MSVFGFIGTGNMGGAMATAARKAVPALEPRERRPMLLPVPDVA